MLHCAREPRWIPIARFVGFIVVYMLKGLLSRNGVINLLTLKFFPPLQMFLVVNDDRHRLKQGITLLGSVDNDRYSVIRLDEKVGAESYFKLWGLFVYFCGWI